MSSIHSKSSNYCVLRRVEVRWGYSAKVLNVAQLGKPKCCFEFVHHNRSVEAASGVMHYHFYLLNKVVLKLICLQLTTVFSPRQL